MTLENIQELFVNRQDKNEGELGQHKGAEGSKTNEGDNKKAKNNNEPSREDRCESCGNKFNTKEKLQEHISKEHERSEYWCDICGIIL